MSNEPQPASYKTHGYHESVLRSHKSRTAEACAAYLLPSIRPDMNILDVGCGPGTITAGFAVLAPQGHVTGIDMGAEVLEHARTSAEQQALTNITFQVGSVLELPFPDNTFDIVHAHQVIQHTTDQVKALQEMRRVTKDGGIVAVRDADMAAMTWFPNLKGLEEWRRIYTAIARSSGESQMLVDGCIFGPNRLASRETRSLSVLRLTCTQPPRKWAGGVTCGRTVLCSRFS